MNNASKIGLGSFLGSFGQGWQEAGEKKRQELEAEWKKHEYLAEKGDKQLQDTMRFFYTAQSAKDEETYNANAAMYNYYRKQYGLKTPDLLPFKLNPDYKGAVETAYSHIPAGMQPNPRSPLFQKAYNLPDGSMPSGVSTTTQPAFGANPFKGTSMAGPTGDFANWVNQSKAANDVQDNALFQPIPAKDRPGDRSLAIQRANTVLVNLYSKRVDPHDPVTTDARQELWSSYGNTGTVPDNYATTIDALSAIQADASARGWAGIGQRGDALEVQKANAKLKLAETVYPSLIQRGLSQGQAMDQINAIVNNAFAQMEGAVTPSSTTGQSPTVTPTTTPQVSVNELPQTPIGPESKGNPTPVIPIKVTTPAGSTVDQVTKNRDRLFGNGSGQSGGGFNLGNIPAQTVQQREAAETARTNKANAAAEKTAKSTQAQTKAEKKARKDKIQDDIDKALVNYNSSGSTTAQRLADYNRIIRLKSELTGKSSAELRRAEPFVSALLSDGAIRHLKNVWKAKYGINASDFRDVDIVARRLKELKLGLDPSAARKALMDAYPSEQPEPLSPDAVRRLTKMWESSPAPANSANVNYETAVRSAVNKYPKLKPLLKKGLSKGQSYKDMYGDLKTNGYIQ
jgi:hypothetical protein